MNLDIQDGYTLAQIARLGEHPADEYVAYSILGALVGAVMDAPELFEEAAHVVIAAYETHLETRERAAEEARRGTEDPA